MNEAELKAGLAQTPGYRYAKAIGEQLHVAGQVPQNAHGVIVGAGEPKVQAAQCLSNLKRLLSCHGFGEVDIQRLTIYVVGPQESLGAAWTAVRDHFSGQVPPSTLLGVALLGYPEQLVEIDAIVIKTSGSV